MRILLLLLLFVVHPGRAQQPDRSAPPKPGPPPSLELPPIHHLQLSNGLEVMLMEKHDIPLIQMRLVIRAGAIMDPEGKTGVASMVAALLTSGAGSRDALQLADAIDYLGATLSASAGNHTSAVSLFTPRDMLDSALVLMADVVLRPVFPGQELQREKKQRLTTLLQWRDSPSSIASVLSYRQLYGEDHPYGRVRQGDEQGIRATTRDDLKRFHETYYRPNIGCLIVVGNITPDELQPKLERGLGPWERRSVPEVSLPPIAQVRGRNVLLVDRPGAAQTSIRIARIGAERLTVDYYAIMVLNTILGGSFTSRLNSNLREEHGYTYGARSYFGFAPLPGPFLAMADVQTDVTDKALAEFMKELNAVHEPVPDDELARGKNYLALRFPAGFQSAGQIAGQLDDLFVYGLPDEYFNAYTAEILAVDHDDVRRVADEYIDTENILIILVGDRKEVEKGVQVLGLGPVENLTIEDVLGKAPDMEGVE
ncbi:MAG: insulinase family protein [Bacteroidetes bacterium]|nr:insulinase family protein [Bacteroidota bacterium]